MGLTYSRVVRAEPAVVSAWHSPPGAITRLMPPWQLVRVARGVPPVRDGQAVLASGCPAASSVNARAAAGQS